MTETKVFWLSDEQIYKVWAGSADEAKEIYQTYCETGNGPVKLKEQYIQVEGE